MIQLDRKSLLFTKCNNKINQVSFICITMQLFSEQKRLTSLNLSGIYQGEPRFRPPSCTTLQQATNYEGSYLIMKLVVFD